MDDFVDARRALNKRDETVQAARAAREARQQLQQQRSGARARQCETAALGTVQRNARRFLASLRDRSRVRAEWDACFDDRTGGAGGETAPALLPAEQQCALAAFLLAGVPPPFFWLGSPLGWGILASISLRQ